MKTVWLTNCHRCEGKNTVVTGRGGSGVRSDCSACGVAWAAYSDYVDEYKVKFAGLGPFPTSVDLPTYVFDVDEADADYVDNKLKGDLDSLVEEVQKKFLESLMSELGYQTYGRGDSDSVRIIWRILGEKAKEMGL